jgi:hypothetical protein
MNYRKSLIPALILGLSIVLVAGPASAWEFSMDGVYTWQYDYLSQQGSNGFFGAYDQAAATAGTLAAGGTPPQPPYSVAGVGAFAPYNFYTGGYTAKAVSSTAVLGYKTYAPYGGLAVALAGGQPIVSGADANWNIMNMSTNVQIRMNQAVRIRGNYFIGSWVQPNYSTSQGLMVSSGLLDQDAPGVQRSFSPGYWRTLWLSAQLPWGEVAVGKRPSSWGMGLQYDGADNRHSESVALTVPYGPFKIQFSFYVARRAKSSDDYGTSTGVYNERADKNYTRAFDTTIPNVQYNSGPVSMGFLCNWIYWHKGGETIIGDPNTTAPSSNNIISWVGGRNLVQAVDYQDQYGAAFFKYNNGRFFLNSEYNYQRVIENRIGDMAANNTEQVPPLYTQHDSGAVEMGVLCGPSKVSVLGAWFTGDDYRYGPSVMSANKPLLVTKGRQSDTWSNVSIFRPYSYLMIYAYGLGASFARDTGEGFVQDASVYAARLDYAVAANLNIYGSFAWAERFSKSGYTWGCLAPDVTQTNGAVVFQNAATGADRIPTIPDTALGYEIDAGFDWKLLEGLTARCTFGYWVPGKWWNYACVDKSITNWGQTSTAAASNNWHTNPGKTIDPIFGVDFKLEGTF